MENLITNFHNPEFLNILGMEIADGIVMCTAALCSFFIMICLQGEHNKITWKRIGLIYLWAFIAVAIFLCSGITEVFRGDVKSTIKSSVNWVGIFVYVYHPIVIALFYQKKRIRIGLKVFVLDYLLITAGAMMYLGCVTIIRDAGKGLYMEEGADQRWISMTLKKAGQFWVINVGNSTDRQPDIDKIQAGGYTSKEDKGHHGFGLLNIRQTVEKQDGILKLETKEDAFSLTVMLPKVG